MPILRYQPADLRSRDTMRLELKKGNIFSQSGEDGILVELFARIGIRHRWCLEFGAWDGVFCSNTCRLIREDDWRAVMIEGDSKKFRDLKNNFSLNKNCYLRNVMIGFDTESSNLEEVLKDTPIPLDFDLMSIDIDGNDWHVWHSVNLYRPRVVVIEFNPTIPDDIVFIQDRNMNISQGCSLAALVELGTKKRYELVAVTNFNAIFVAEEDYSQVGLSDNAISAFRVSPGGRIFCGYDGTIFQTLDRLKWNGREVPIHSTSLQILPPERLRYNKPRQS